MINGTPAVSLSSHSAAALHARLQAATRDARQAIAHRPALESRRRRRLPAGAPWAMMQALLHEGGSVDRALSLERALRRVLGALLNEGARADGGSGREPGGPADIEAVTGPSLIIRSGPWPVLRSLLGQLATIEQVHPITVLCHGRDEAGLNALGTDLGLEFLPLFYPRFEPFNTSTLRALIAKGTWQTTFVLDASKGGRGEALEHVMAAVSSPDVYIWNGGGTAWRQKTLRERLSPESYALVRGLLRWYARRQI